MAGNQEILSMEEMPDGDDSSIIMEITLSEFKSRFIQVESEEKPPSRIKPQCPEVPSGLRSDKEDTEGYYEPRVMSFGPYHHGKSNLQAGEKLKLKLAARYYKEFWEQREHENEEISISNFWKFQNENWDIKKLRECYDASRFMKEYRDEEFRLMLVVDGFALLSYILFVCLGLFDHDIKYQDLSRIHQDALLLENQLPSQLLLDLMKKSPFPNDTWTSILQEFFGMTHESSFSKLFREERESFLTKTMDCCCRPFPPIMKMKKLRKSESDIEQSKPWHHLLHLYRQNLLGDGGSYLKQPTTAKKGKEEEEENEKKKKKSLGSVEDVKEQLMASFRNVKELMAAGIRIKPSSTRYLRDISFTSNGITACLRLPPIAIDGSTKTLFLNLMAYELSSDLPHDFISYLRFLDSLIDHADDVNELQSAGIVQNSLGTHQEVADFFNTVSCNLESNFQAYKDVRIKIRKHLKSHYNNRRKIWITQCLDTYFASPWTIIAWVAAAFVIFLTAVQTYWAVFKG